MNKNSRYIPVIAAISIVLGIIIGNFYANHFSGNRLSIINTSSNKLDDLMRIINDQYVDSVDAAKLVEDAMPSILAELDPHSVYIPAKSVESANEDLKGSFSGIGIQFTIQDDTIHVNSVIKGGPSEKVGLLAGDRIIAINGKSFVGKVCTNEEAMRRLKGEKGSEVKVTVRRNGTKKPITFKIVRGDIPVKSIDAAYMLTSEVGYIKVKNFGETTYPELLVSLARLNQEGFKSLVIDLRGNTGGYMTSAIQMVNEFLPAGRLIVYTQGRKSPRQEYKSDGRGTYQGLPLVVLVDEISASASEIFAGAIQDNDRGTIVGRRSFGKGLVQQPIEFRDGSMLRLTIARYYTPSGRCIQKPYQKGHDDNYEMDLITRYERGEFFSQDSIHQNGPKFKTRNGRTVYGGGGIMPDIFVPQDTIGFTSYYSEAIRKGLITQFTFQYTDNNRAVLSQYREPAELVKYLKTQNIVSKFVKFAEEHGLRRRNLLIAKSHTILERSLYGSIIYYMLDMEDYTKFLNATDPAIDSAIKALREKEKKAAPRKPKGRKVAAADFDFPFGTQDKQKHYALLS
ncbi:MAG: S41 family peptidase [Bacteroidaceae bacterium]|nr:S41 family peptidase [Bacteroidaceae bacterium]